MNTEIPDEWSPPIGLLGYRIKLSVISAEGTETSSVVINPDPFPVDGSVADMHKWLDESHKWLKPALGLFINERIMARMRKDVASLGNNT